MNISDHFIPEPSEDDLALEQHQIELETQQQEEKPHVKPSQLMPALPTTAPTTTALSNNGVFQVNNFNEAINAASFLSASSLVPADYRRWVPVKNQYGKAVTNADGTPS